MKSIGDRFHPGARQVSARREIVALHQAIFRRNRARINASVLGYTAAFRRYERTYARGVRSYERRASFAELDRAMAQTGVVYVGDYHTLAQSQRAFLRLLRRLPQDRPVTLALELIQARRQRELDAFLAGPLSAEGFRKLVNPDFGAWPNYQEIFELAQQRGYRVIGIDAVGRGPAGRTLRARDAYAARLCARAHRARPDALLMVFVGELHTAPSHLPARLREELGAAALRSVIVHQNCEPLYWELERRGLEHEVELVKVRTGTYCLMNTPPIVCQQSFLNWLDIDEGFSEIDAPEETFREYARLIADFFDLPLGDALDEVEITSVVDLSFLRRLQRRGDFSAVDMHIIRKQILASESYYIPRARMVYLGRLAINHASEEATHFLRHVCADSEEPRQLVDAFYARCLEEALGFLGSKVINHRRKCAHEPYFERVVKSRSQRWQYAKSPGEHPAYL